MKIALHHQLVRGNYSINPHYIHVNRHYHSLIVFLKYVAVNITIYKVYFSGESITPITIAVGQRITWHELSFYRKTTP